MRTAIYPGSFDPVTNGHLDLIKRALQLFDRLMVAIADNAEKECLFTTKEREKMVKEALGRDLPMNVDGAVAAVLCEMDFPPEMGNGLFAIARTVGLTAHVFDEITAQRPMRRISPTAQEYSGPPERDL